MTTTTNYNLNIVEGTDVVNPLVQFNPNFTSIDGIMKNNADASIDRATCVKSGTNHAVTRSNTDASVFRFTATGNWDTGDTMTVDTVPVSVYTPNGSALLTGAFVINTEVLASIQGTRVVIYTANTQATSIDASDVVYDNTVSGLSSTNAQGAIDELRTAGNILYDNTVSGLSATNVNDAIDEVASSVTSGSYTKVAEALAGLTYSAQLASLATAYSSLTNEQKLSAKIIRSGIVHHLTSITDGSFSVGVIGAGLSFATFNITDTSYKTVNGSWTVSDKSSQTNGSVLELWAFV